MVLNLGSSSADVTTNLCRRIPSASLSGKIRQLAFPVWLASYLTSVPINKRQFKSQFDEDSRATSCWTLLRLSLKPLAILGRACFCYFWIQKRRRLSLFDRKTRWKVGSMGCPCVCEIRLRVFTVLGSNIQSLFVYLSIKCDKSPFVKHWRSLLGPVSSGPLSNSPSMRPLFRKLRCALSFFFSISFFASELFAYLSAKGRLAKYYFLDFKVP